ncbi:MAG: Rid family detoxifying hydrolase [candidate division WOR-3 bacterium]|jgi:2-iminobutanoate/2-iminopropanoate deaminase
MKKIFNEKAPKPVGPYSQAIRAGDFLFISGTLPIDPVTGNIIEGDIETLTQRTLENIKIILEGEKLSFDNLVKVNIYIKNMSDFSKINSVYEKYFKNHLPARAVVEASNLPKNSPIEIEAVAFYES